MCSSNHSILISCVRYLFSTIRFCFVYFWCFDFSLVARVQENQRLLDFRTTLDGSMNSNQFYSKRHCWCGIFVSIAKRHCRRSHQARPISLRTIWRHSTLWRQANRSRFENWSNVHSRSRKESDRRRYYSRSISKWQWIIRILQQIQIPWNYPYFPVLSVSVRVLRQI